MIYNGKQYKEAQNIIKIYEKERTEIKKFRSYQRFNVFDCRNIKDFCWLRRIYIQSQMVLIGNNQHNHPQYNEYIDWINSLKKELLISRKKQFKS